MLARVVKTNPPFKPVELNITLHTKAELDMLKAVCRHHNEIGNVICEEGTESYDRLRDMLIDLGRALEEA